jgi:hypothetical protein
MDDAKISGLTAGTPTATDTFPFQRGGTANFSATPGAIGVGAKTYFDTLYLALVAPGTSGNVLTSNGSAWTSDTADALKLAMFNSKVISGVIHNQLWVGGFKPTLTSGCAASAQIEMGTNKNVYDYLAFDKDTIEYAYANVPMPADYTGGAIYFKPYWLHPATTTNFKVSWGLAGVSISNDDTLDAAQGTAIYSNDTGGTASDLYIAPLSAAVTIGGSPVANDLVNFRCLRKADDGTNDTLAVDAYLLGFMIYYPVA